MTLRPRIAHRSRLGCVAEHSGRRAYYIPWFRRAIQNAAHDPNKSKAYAANPYQTPRTQISSTNSPSVVMLKIKRFRRLACG
jgi:hypothetical protein